MQFKYRSVTVAALAAMTLASTSFAAASSASVKAPSNSNTKTVTTVTVGAAAAQATTVPLYVGLSEGIFAKHDLNLSLTYGTPTSISAAVINGDVDFAISSVSQVPGIIASSTAEVVGTSGPSLLYVVARPGIAPECTKFSCSYAGIAKFEGKTIATTAPGGANDLALRLALHKAGIPVGTGSNAVAITYVQTASAAIAAVETGSVSAAAIGAPYTLEGEQQGLISTANFTQFVADSEFTVNTEWAKDHKQVLGQLLTAYCDATKQAIKSATDSENALQQYADLTNAGVLRGTWLESRLAWGCEPFPVSLMGQIVAADGHTVGNVKLARSIVNNSFMDKVPKSDLTVLKSLVG